MPPAPFPAYVSLVTLGVADVARATAFYTALGFTPSSAGSEEITFLRAGTVTLALFGRDALAADAGATTRPAEGFRDVTLAANQPTREAVDAAYAHALAVGARSLVAPEEVFWGGYRGYVADPDGHVWEIAHNPFLPVDATGAMALPD